LRSKISENSVRSKLSFAAVGGGILFAQPHKIGVSKKTFFGGECR
jgi:hypothetical protein